MRRVRGGPEGGPARRVWPQVRKTSDLRDFAGHGRAPQRVGGLRVSSKVGFLSKHLVARLRQVYLSYFHLYARPGVTCSPS